METLMINIFIVTILGMICFLGGIIFATRNNKNNNQRILRRDNNNNIYNNVSNRDNRGVDRPTPCYENGEITNLCTIIALKNIKREMQNILTSVEKDALNKAVDNTIIVEKLKAFIDNVELEDIDIDE